MHYQQMPPSLDQANNVILWHSRDDFASAVPLPYGGIWFADSNLQILNPGVQKID